MLPLRCKPLLYEHTKDKLSQNRYNRRWVCRHFAGKKIIKTRSSGRFTGQKQLPYIPTTFIPSFYRWFRARFHSISHTENPEGLSQFPFQVGRSERNRPFS